LSGLALLSPRLSAATRALSPRDTIGLLRLGINPEAQQRGRAWGSSKNGVELRKKVEDLPDLYLI